MKPVLTAARSRACERYATEKLGIKSSDFIKKAALALYKACIARDPEGRVCVLCGKGNNGVIGLYLAHLMAEKDLNVSILSPFTQNEIHRGELFFCEAVFNATPLSASVMFHDKNVVVDCLSGTGFHGAPDKICRDILAEAKNQYIIAADVPTGIDPDTGTVFAGAVKVDETIVFSTYKPYCFLYPAKDFAGRISVVNIGMPEEAILEQEPYLFATDDGVLSLVPDRQDNSHKGTFGKVRVVCGSPDKAGAAILCTSGALYGGAGLVALSVRRSVRSEIRRYYPEPIGEALLSDKKEDCAVIGCGLGLPTGICLRYYLAKKTPLVIDADALTYLSKHPNILEYKGITHVLTPHPLEMARLTGLSLREVEADRVNIARDYAKNANAVVVLKGHHTLVALPDGNVYINTTGNPGLAKGGSGDVLAGLIGGLIARGMTPESAAIVAVYVHGKAADDIASEASASGVLPSKIAERAACYLK